MLIYKIRDKKTGLFKVKGVNAWRAYGDTYSTLGKARNALSNMAYYVNRQDVEIVEFEIKEVNTYVR